MQAIIVSIISGFFSLAAIWLQNSLHQKSQPREAEPVTTQTPVLSRQPENKKQDSMSRLLRIVFTLIIVASPFLLLLTVGKETLSRGDEYLWAYYSVWLVITLAALLIGWKIKTLFEKILLIADVLLLIFMTVMVM